LNNLPDYASKLETLSDLEDFQDESEINKIILFSKRSKTPPIYKVLTADFKDKIRFGFVSGEAEEVIKKFSIESFPVIKVLKSVEGGEKMEKEEVIEYPKNEFKLDDLKDFVGKYARDSVKYKESSSSSKSSSSSS